MCQQGDDKVIRVWEWQTSKIVRTIRGQVGPGPEGTIYAMALSPDARLMAIGGHLGAVRGNKPPEDEEANPIRLYEFATDKLVTLLKGHTNVVLSLAFSPDGKRLISGSYDQSAIIWDVESNKLVRRLEGHTAEIYSVGFTPDRERAVTGYICARDQPRYNRDEGAAGAYSGTGAGGQSPQQEHAGLGPVDRTSDLGFLYTWALPF